MSGVLAVPTVPVLWYAQNPPLTHDFPAPSGPARLMFGGKSTMYTVLVLPVQSTVGAGKMPRPICRASSDWTCASDRLQLAALAHVSGTIVNAPPKLPGRMAW